MSHRLFVGLMLLLLATACKTRPMPEPVAQAFDYATYAERSPQRLLFKTRLNLAKEEFSGLLVIKETAPEQYRTVFTTETGFKLFDLTVMDDAYTVNYGVGPIEKKFIAVRLAYTVQAMLLRKFKALSAHTVANGTETGRFGAGKYAYSVEKKGREAQTQTVYHKGKRKAEARFSAFGTDGVPDSATVTHFGFPLKASFRFLQQ